MSLKYLNRKYFKFKYLAKYLKLFFLYIWNVFFNKIPINIIRLYIAKLYIDIDSSSFIAMNVKIINSDSPRSNIKIGKNCVINPECLLDGRLGKIEIHDNVDIARGTWIYTLEHDLNDDYHKTKQGDVIIEEYAWIASRVIILPGVRIGRGSVVASGAIVTKDVPSLSIVGGVPAKVIGVRKSGLKYKLTFRPLFYV